MIPKEILDDPELKTECEETDRLALEILEGQKSTKATVVKSDKPVKKPVITGQLKQSVRPRNPASILFDQMENISPEERKLRDQAHIEKHIKNIMGGSK